MTGPGRRRVERETVLKRPLRLSLSAWFVIALGIGNAVQLFFFGGLARELTTPGRLPLWYLYLAAFLLPMLLVLCGAGLLMAREWARILWIALCLVFFTQEAFHAPISVPRLAGGVVGMALWFWILFHPVVTDYFVAVSSQRDPYLR